MINMCFEYLLSHMSSNGLVFAIIHYINVSDSSIVPPVHTLKSGFCRFCDLISYSVFIFTSLNRTYYLFLSFVVETFTPSSPFVVRLIPIIIFHALNIIHPPRCLSKLAIYVSKTMLMILAATILIFLLANSLGVIMNILTLCDNNNKLSKFAPIF